MRIKQNPIVKGLAALMVIIPIYFLATDSKEESDVQTSPKESEKGTGKPVQTENEAIAAMSAYLSTVEGEQKRMKESLDNAVTKDDLQQIIDSSKNNTGDSVDEEALLICLIDPISIISPLWFVKPPSATVPLLVDT